ncbi:MAG: sugar phosphate nucleotidyltransferase, partial [bacterium]
MKPTLVILAAGMASRYGGMKQIESFGPGGETIMDYSIYDAIRAGFGKVVFIIRKDFADNFKAIFEPRLQGRIEIDYVYQELQAFMGVHEVPADRTKPWGTAHAVLCAKDAVREPFAVINADDFYGRDAFEKAHGFLTQACDEKTYSIIGYSLVKT